MNPSAEPPILKPEAAETPDSFLRLRPGQNVTCGLVGGNDTRRFRIERIQDNRVTIRIVDKPAPGRRWLFRGIPRGAQLRMGRLIFTIVSRTNKTLRLEPHSIEQPPS